MRKVFVCANFIFAHKTAMKQRQQFDFSIERQRANCRNDRFKFAVEIDF